jgi:hypothetical protein
LVKKKKTVSATSLLREIDELLENSKYYQSRESGKRFYDSDNFPPLLAGYVAQTGGTLKANAKRFGMSPKTLEKLMSGGPLSDNMIFRIRSALAIEVAAAAKKAIFPGEWHDATPAKVSAAISEVSARLVFLKKVVEGSNFLVSEESPIDKIQVVQLMALLTATVEALRAPFVDKKQTSGFFRWLGKLARTSAEKGVEKVVVDAMSDAASAGSGLLRDLSSKADITDLGNILP